MSLTYRNPPEVAVGGKYSLGVEVPAGQRLLFLSGLVGNDAEGRLLEGIERQAEQAFENIVKVLASAGMDFHDVVKLTCFLTDSANLAAFRKVRERYLQAPYPASTLLVVAALANPAMLVEVELVAAKADAAGGGA